MQDALGRKAIHAALRSLTNICSGLLDCEAESVRYVFGRVKGVPLNDVCLTSTSTHHRAGG
jgi:hypothetical protein